MRRIVTVALLVGVVPALTASPAHAADLQFTLTADYQGLYPNAQIDVPVTVRNPQAYPIEVYTASATIGDARPECPSRYIAVTTFSGTVRVPAYGSAIVPMHFHMLATAPDTCQGATFPLTFRAGGAPASDTTTGSGVGGFAFTGNGSGTLVVAAAGAVAVALGAILVRSRRRSAR